MAIETTPVTAAASSKDHLDYLSQGPFSDPRDLTGRLAAIVDRVGPDPQALAEAVRGLMVHVFWRHAYGLEDEPRRARCGFAGYFLPHHWEDHWVVERWDGRCWRIGDRSSMCS